MIKQKKHDQVTSSIQAADYNHDNQIIFYQYYLTCYNVFSKFYHILHCSKKEPSKKEQTKCFFQLFPEFLKFPLSLIGFFFNYIKQAAYSILIR